MTLKFSLDLEPLKKAINRAPEEFRQGAAAGLEAVKDEWVMEAVDIAPVDKGDLRRSIKGRVKNDGLNSNVTITANAVTRTRAGTRFNYAYYIHEKDAGGRRLRTPGTEKKFLDKSFDQKRFQKILEDKIFGRLRGKGWTR